MNREDESGACAECGRQIEEGAFCEACRDALMQEVCDAQGLAREGPLEHLPGLPQGGRVGSIRLSCGRVDQRVLEKCPDCGQAVLTGEDFPRKEEVRFEFPRPGEGPFGIPPCCGRSLPRHAVCRCQERNFR